jgi:hypothetical protein
MEYASDSRGDRKWTWELSLETAKAQAKAQAFECYHCHVPVDVVQMPNLTLATAARRADPRFSEFYFRTRPLNPHVDCRFEPRLTNAVIEKRVIRSKSGQPGAPPAAISFERELVRKLGTEVIDDYHADALAVVRGRYVEGDEPLRQRGDRATVCSTIERAAFAHAGRKVPPWQPLTVDVLPKSIQTYGGVFRRASDALPGMIRIWYATLSFTRPPVFEGNLLRLQCFDRDVVIDRTGWGTRPIMEFDAALDICLDWVRERWQPGGKGVNPRIYVLTKCTDETGPLVAYDARKLCLAVQDAS